MRQRFKHHGCAKCYWLGQYGDYDLWWCTKEPEDVLARYGSEKDQYRSVTVTHWETLSDHSVHFPLKEALRRRNNHAWALDRLRQTTRRAT